MFILIHYWFPVALGWSIATIIHHATGLPFLSAGLHLYLLGILAAYSLDRIVDNDDPIRPPWVNGALIIALILSAVLGIHLSLQLSIQTFSALLVFCAATIIYVRVKKIPLLKAAWVAIVWVWAGIAIPFANGHWFAWQFWTTSVSLPVVILMICNVTLCDLKDIDSDKIHGVKSLPAIIGLRKTLVIVSSLLVIASIISFHENRIGLLLSSVLLFLFAQFPQVLSTKVLGPLIVDASMVLPGVLIALHVIS